MKIAFPGGATNKTRLGTRPETLPISVLGLSRKQSPVCLLLSIQSNPTGATLNLGYDDLGTVAVICSISFSDQRWCTRVTELTQFAVGKPAGYNSVDTGFGKKKRSTIPGAT